MFQDPSKKKIVRKSKRAGLIPRCLDAIFEYVDRKGNAACQFLVRCAYIQIYNEQMMDLLDTDRPPLSVRDVPKKGVFVEGLSEWVVRSPAEVLHLMNLGNRSRITSETLINEKSSRSHAVFIIVLEQSVKTFFWKETGERLSWEKFCSLDQVTRRNKIEISQQFKVGKLNLVDLAGSENIRISQAEGERLKETCNINKSLLCLGNVIRGLIANSRGEDLNTSRKKRRKKKMRFTKVHVPYRDSKLTRLLKDSLGGNCRTFLIGTMSPSLNAMGESVRTLQFIQQAKQIKNKPYVNKDADQKTIIQEYERELKKLRRQLEETRAMKTEEGKAAPGEIEEIKRKAAEDKLAVITLLEQRSREVMHSRQEKRKLEEKIGMLQSRLIGGTGNALLEDRNFKVLIHEERERVKKEHRFKMNELEKERKQIEEEKAQVDRYKALLLKQRDIMVALTTRLNERDEAILEMEEEVHAYDKHFMNLERALDEQKNVLMQAKKMLLNQLPPEGCSVVKRVFSLIIRDDDRHVEKTQQENIPKTISNITNLKMVNKNHNFKRTNGKEGKNLNLKEKDKRKEEKEEGQKFRISNIGIGSDSVKDVRSLDQKNVNVRALDQKKTREFLEDETRKDEIKMLKVKISLLGSSLKKVVRTEEKKKRDLAHIWKEKVKVLLDHVYRDLGTLQDDKNREKVIETKHRLVSILKLVASSVKSLEVNKYSSQKK